MYTRHFLLNTAADGQTYADDYRRPTDRQKGIADRYRRQTDMWKTDRVFYYTDELSNASHW